MADDRADTRTEGQGRDVPRAVRYVFSPSPLQPYVTLSLILILNRAGNEEWFRSGGIPDAQIVTLDWWESVVLRPRSGNEDEEYPEVKFVCTPAQHASGAFSHYLISLCIIAVSIGANNHIDVAIGRGFFDQRATLWCSWVVQQTSDDPDEGTASVYHAGDTGYMTQDGPCPAFAGASVSSSLFHCTTQLVMDNRYNRDRREVRPVRPRDDPHLARRLALVDQCARVEGEFLSSLFPSYPSASCYAYHGVHCTD